MFMPGIIASKVGLGWLVKIKDQRNRALLVYA